MDIHPDVHMDTNGIERQIRPMALERKYLDVLFV